MGSPDVPSDRSSPQWHQWIADRFELMAASWSAGDRAAWLGLYSPSLSGELPANVALREAPGVAERDWDSAHQPAKQWLEQRVDAVHVCGDEVAVECRYGGVVAGVEQYSTTVELWHLDANGLFDHYRTFMDIGSPRHDAVVALVSQWCEGWSRPSLEVISSIVTDDYSAEDPVGSGSAETLSEGWERFRRAGVAIEMSCRGVHVCGDEAAAKMHLVASPGGETLTRAYVTVFTLSADGRICSQRTFG